MEFDSGLFSERGWSKEAIDFFEQRKDSKFVQWAISKLSKIKSPRFYAPKEQISPSLRKSVFERDAYRCRHCNDWHDLTCDHIFPESKGGSTDLENLQTLCRSCNSKKGSQCPKS